MAHGKCACLVSDSKTRLDSTDLKKPVGLLESPLPLMRSVEKHLRTLLSVLF